MGLQWDKPSINWCRISSIHSIITPHNYQTIKPWFIDPGLTLKSDQTGGWNPPSRIASKDIETAEKNGTKRCI